jgi:RNA polymerase sigma factor (TIGR02999 family)
MKPATKDVTRLLEQLRAGDRNAVADLVPLLYDELRQLASKYLRRERPGHTLQATALVHEAYLRLVDQKDVGWQNRSHFFGVAAQQMRRILVDHARHRHAAKRGGAAPKVALDEALVVSDQAAEDVLQLNELLTRLDELDEQQARVVELRVFGGLTVEEAAEALDISPATVKRDWAMAKAWLTREIQRERKGESGAVEQS